MKPSWLKCATCLWAETLSDNADGTAMICHWNRRDAISEHLDCWCNHWTCAACRQTWEAEHNLLICRTWFNQAPTTPKPNVTG